MEEAVADMLLDTMGRHSGMMPLDRETFRRVLVATDMPESSRFHEELPENKQTFDEVANERRYHRFSLRRALRNENARGYRLSAAKKFLEFALSVAGSYSTDSLTRNLRADPDIVNLMAGCRYPFSLLGKLETYDFGNKDERLFRITRPVLFIPDSDGEAPIYSWEDKNTRYEKADTFVLIRRTTRDCYLRA